MRKVTDQFQGSYIQSIHDPQQTHALYGISISDIPRAKMILSEEGADKFRVVKTQYGTGIICFRLKK